MRPPQHLPRGLFVSSLLLPFLVALGPASTYTHFQQVFRKFGVYALLDNSSSCSTSCLQKQSSLSGSLDIFLSSLQSDLHLLQSLQPPVHSRSSAFFVELTKTAEFASIAKSDGSLQADDPDEGGSCLQIEVQI
ncbi:unnamed protein product [Protopolystoma xenopodis]|uniref:Uncharacterized protein n=1 Tax=Protopolystoma xenopodis TaxID=117903 RepID=A0A3S5FC17_9PLAT|nr:unnamed protein product [Protopolystoma xenopodis]